MHGNGNTNQSTWASGNSINNQLGLGALNPVIGGISANIGVTAGIGGFSTAIALPITVGNGSNVGLTAGLNPATSISANVGAGLALGVGGFNIAGQAPIAAPVNIGIPIAANVGIQAACGAGAGACVNSGGSATATAGTQTNGTLNQAVQTQTTGATDVDAINNQNSTSDGELQHQHHADQPAIRQHDRQRRRYGRYRGFSQRSHHDERRCRPERCSEPVEDERVAGCRHQ